MDKFAGIKQADDLDEGSGLRGVPRLIELGPGRLVFVALRCNDLLASPKSGETGIGADDNLVFEYRGMSETSEVPDKSRRRFSDLANWEIEPRRRGFGSADSLFLRSGCVPGLLVMVLVGNMVLMI